MCFTFLPKDANTVEGLIIPNILRASVEVMPGIYDAVHVVGSNV
jgi:hypothetical protein